MDYRRYRLDQLLEIKYGKDKKLVESTDGKYPIFGTGGLMGYANDFLYDKPSILIGRKGTISKVKYVNEPFWTVDTLFWTKINDAIVDPKFLYYKLSCIDFNNYNEGTTIPSLRTETLNRIELEIPDLETQQKIVSILSALDQKIDLNNGISNNLLRVSHQIYLNEIKNASITKTVRLGELCKIKYGKGLSMSKILENGYRVYGGNGIIGFYNEKMYNKSQILISCRGAASGKVIFTRPECFITNNSLILECDEKYHYFIKEFSLDREYYDYTTGSAQPQVTIDNVKDAELPLPNDEILTNFNTALCPIEKKYFTILDENESLMELRDTLLPKLMSGMINIDRITANGEQ